MRGSTTLHAPSAENLFGVIDVTKPVFGDSEASQIALTNVRLLLLKFEGTTPTKPVVYEAEIVDEEGSSTKDAIYVRLSPQCIGDQQLVDGSCVDVEIQFCVDRLHFCRMHRAVDKLHERGDLEVVFPSKNDHPALM